MPGKRGRPKKDWVQPARMFGRALRAICSYHEARRSGLKHSSAVTDVALALRISESEVKQTLASFQPQGAPSVFIVKKIAGPITLPPGFCTLGIPEGKTVTGAFSLGFGPRPTYPRINTKSPKNPQT
jgi:hypothetical protein